MPGIASLDDTCGILEELSKVYVSARSDALEIACIKQIVKDTKDHCQEHQQEIQQVVDELAQRVCALQKETTRKVPEAVHIRDLEALAHEKNEIIERINQLENEQRALEEAIAYVRQQSASLVSRSQSLQKQDAEESGQLRDLISLFASASRLRWVFDKKDKIEGYVTLPNRRDARPFSLYPNDDSVAIANHLWELMEER